MTNRPSDEEIIADIERRRVEGTDFDDLIPVNATTPPSPRMVFSIRLAYEELKAISEAAEARRIPVGDFIRRSALEAARESRETPDRLESLQKEMREGFADLRKELHDSLTS